ncbi:MAG: Helix-turn-helix domain [Actinomycetota bacterium]|jgi:hypothetical protein|nr:Helix-turn-helix domain [Actinomycetota bacterium]
MAAEDAWLDEEEAARVLGVTVSAVHALIHRGLLSAVGPPPYRVRRDAIDACIERCRIPPGALPFSKRLDPPRSAQPRFNRDGTPDRRYGQRCGNDT